MTSVPIRYVDVINRLPANVVPHNVVLSPNKEGPVVATFLYPDESQGGRLQLFYITHGDSFCCNSLLIKALDLKGAFSASLSLEEQLRRERMRLFVQGISTFEFATHYCKNESLILLFEC